MNRFMVEEIKPNVYRMIVKDDKEILDVFERWDARGSNLAKIGLFAFVHPIRLDFNNPNIDRFLFLDT